jgi:hypothetical protein
MAISRKPKTIEQTAKEPNIAALINKGGSAAETTIKEKEEKPILLRVPSEVLTQIDAIVSSKRIKTPRHTWLLEAVFEKLEREV